MIGSWEHELVLGPSFKHRLISSSHLKIGCRASGKSHLWLKRAIGTSYDLTCRDRNGVGYV